LESKKALDNLCNACDKEVLYEQCGILDITELAEPIEKDLIRLKNLKQYLILKLERLNKGIFYSNEERIDGKIDMLKEILKEVFNYDCSK
jgi:hypothetical protein